MFMDKAFSYLKLCQITTWSRTMDTLIVKPHLAFQEYRSPRDSATPTEYKPLGRVESPGNLDFRYN